MTRVRIAITGIGAICAIGRNAAAFTEALARGERGFSKIGDPRLKGLRATHAALVRDLGPDPEAPEELLGHDRCVQLALCALREALVKAGLAAHGLGARGGVVLGTCSGGMLSIERHYEALARGEDPIDAELLFSKRYYTAAKVLAWASGARGPALTVVTACAAGTGAIAQAADLIRAGLADVVAAGGADAFAPSTLAGFDALKATAEGMCAPFSQPIGLNLGEGAAFLVLELLDRALERGAPILAELLGTGLSNDAYHPTAPDPSARGQLAAMQAALADAGITAARIDYINAHGTGTRANDPAESRAIARLLGDRAAAVPVSSTKSMIGHCLGGAGALEAAAAVLAARAGFVPPTAGFVGRREGCDLDYVPDVGRCFSGRIALSNSFGFAGNNACVVVDAAPEAGGIGAAVRPEGCVAVVTGCGAISPLGVGLGPLLGGESAVAPIDRFDAPVRPFPAGLVPRVEAREVDRRLDLKGMDLCSRYAALAARAALDAAALKPRPRAPSEVGLVVGIATGPGQGEAEHLDAVFRGDFVLQHLGAFPYVVPNEVAGNVARALLLRGHSTVIAAGQGAGLAACASAAIAVALGHADAIVAAAADELTPRSVADGFKVGLFGPDTSVVPGEGAAAFVLESRTAAAARGTRPLAELLGVGLVTEGASSRGGDRAAACLRAAKEALARAGIAPADVSALVAGSAETGAPDEEIRALGRLFGGRLEPGRLAARIGFAEAALPLIELAVAIERAAPGDVLLAACASPEGFASAVVLRRL